MGKVHCRQSLQTQHTNKQVPAWDTAICRSNGIISVPACTDVCMYIHTYIYIYTHTRIYIHSQEVRENLNGLQGHGELARQISGERTF